MIDEDSSAPTPRVRPARRHGWVRALVAVVVVALIVGSVWAVWFSTLLAVRDVRVVGAEGASAERVLAAAAITAGEPLARVDAEGAARRVTELAWVASAEVRRGWPSEVVIAVQPRTPAAKIAGTNQVADAGGVVFDLPGRLPDGLPSVRATDEALTEAMAVLASLPEELRSRVRVVTASTRDDVGFVLGNGTTIRWGSAERGDLKAQVVAALLPRRARMIDVTAPELPTTFAERPKRKAADTN